MAPSFESLEKRQGFTDPGTQTQTSSSTYFYWREWAVFVAIVASLVLFVTLARAHGRRRLAKGQPLMTYHRWLFPALLRQQGYGQSGYAMTSVPDPYASYPYGQQGAPTSGSQRHNGRTGGIAPVPPAYDPYAQNLPAYEAVSKSSGDHAPTTVATQPIRPAGATGNTDPSVR